SCNSELEDAWLAALHTVAIETLAFLDAPAATQLLESAVPGACRATASPRMLGWLDVYDAVAQRDASAMATSAEQLLRGTPELLPELRHYALVAGMLGRLASHDAEGVDRLWEQYRNPRDTQQP